MKSPYVLLLTALLLAFNPGRVLGQTDHAHGQHAEMNSRSDHVMGFSHEKTTHHFRLYLDGGSIEVQANEPQDTATLAIRFRCISRTLHGCLQKATFERPCSFTTKSPQACPP